MDQEKENGNWKKITQRIFGGKRTLESEREEEDDEEEEVKDEERKKELNKKDENGYLQIGK